MSIIVSLIASSWRPSPWAMTVHRISAAFIASHSIKAFNFFSKQRTTNKTDLWGMGDIRRTISCFARRKPRCSLCWCHLTLATVRLHPNVDPLAFAFEPECFWKWKYISITRLPFQPIDRNHGGPFNLLSNCAAQIASCLVLSVLVFGLGVRTGGRGGHWGHPVVHAGRLRSIRFQKNGW